MAQLTTADGIPIIGSEAPPSEEERQQLDQIVSLVKRLINAAKEPKAHGSCARGAECKGCEAVRDGKEFVLAMRA
jgi:hypothetical protein